MTHSLNESINADHYTNVDLNFTKPGENHILFDLESIPYNHAFSNALQKSLWYRSTVLSVLGTLLEDSKALLKEIDTELE